MLKNILLLSICALIISCASTSSKVYKQGVLSNNKSYSLAFAYETGEEETSVNNDEIERKVTRKGQRSNFLALRDNIYFNLMDKGISIVDKSTTSDVTIALHPTARISNCQVTCGAINTLSVVFRETKINKPVARILINNGDRTATTMDDIEFATYASDKIYALIISK